MNKINKSQIKDLANLYDIKTLSQAIADKGWACLCKEGNFLSKDVAPTLYNDMVAKLDSADEDWSSIQAGLNKDNHGLTNLCYINNKLYFTDNDNVFYSLSYTSGSNVIQVNNISNIISMHQGNNCIIALSPFKAYKINPTDNSVIELGSIEDTYYEGIFKVFNGKIYFIPYNSAISEYTKIYEFVDDNSSSSMTVYNYNGYVSDVDFYDGYYYLVSLNDDVRYILKGLNLGNNDLADTSKWELVKQINNVNYDKYYTQIFFAEDKCVLFVFSGGLRGYDYYVLDVNTFDTIYNTGYNQFGAYISQIVLCDNIFYGVKKELNLESRDVFTYCSIFDITNKSNWVTDSELSDFDRPYDIGFYSFLVLPTLQLFSINTSSSRQIYHRGIAKTVYTDTFVINGNTVTIDYAKAQDETKIVTEFSQITPMQIIGNYFGYCNYFFLSQAIGYQGVNLPYNSNLWTMIYVGDDYQETNLPTGNSIPFALKTDLDILPDQSGQSGKYLTTDGSTLSWAEVQGGGGTSIISTINTAVAPDTTSVNTGTDLSDDTILGVYINGLYQIDSSDYTMSTSGGESTIGLATTYSTTVALNVVYATSVDIADLSYNDLSNKPSINGVTLSGDISLSSLGIQSQNLSLMNIEASTWSVSEAYPDYAYECSLPCTGVTTNSFAQVVFSPEDAASGNYANICTTSTDSVTIYGKVDTTITIPTIIVMGV